MNLYHGTSTFVMIHVLRACCPTRRLIATVLPNKTPTRRIFSPLSRCTMTLWHTNDGFNGKLANADDRVFAYTRPSRLVRSTFLALAACNPCILPSVLPVAQRNAVAYEVWRGIGDRHGQKVGPTCALPWLGRKLVALASTALLALLSSRKMADSQPHLGPPFAGQKVGPIA